MYFSMVLREDVQSTPNPHLALSLQAHSDSTLTRVTAQHGTMNPDWGLSPVLTSYVALGKYFVLGKSQFLYW